MIKGGRLNNRLALYFCVVSHLRDDRDGRSQRAEPDVGDVHAVDLNGAVLQLDEAEEADEEAGLARAGPPHDPCCWLLLAWLVGQGDLRARTGVLVCMHAPIFSCGRMAAVKPCMMCVCKLRVRARHHEFHHP